MHAIGACYEFMLATSGGLLLLGVALVVAGYWQHTELMHLAVDYPRRNFNDAEECVRIRIRGKVGANARPRWRDPIDGTPVVLARLIVRDLGNVVVDVYRGQSFEIESDTDTGERAKIETQDATLEGPSTPVQLRWPADENLKAFLTVGALRVLNEIQRRRGGPGGTIAGTATVVRADDVVEVFGVAHRRSSDPQEHGHRSPSAQLVLGGSAEAPVVVVKRDLDAALARSRALRRSGYTLVAISLGGPMTLWIVAVLLLG